MITLTKKIIFASSLMVLLAGCKGTTVDEQGYTTTDSGLRYKDIVVGEGEPVKKGDTVSAHYTGTLEDGTQFDTSRDTGVPFSFEVGAGDVIQGWDEGVQGMNVGGTRELIIPADLAYGEGGVPGVIPENATLIFEVEVVEIL